MIFTPQTLINSNRCTGKEGLNFRYNKLGINDENVLVSIFMGFGNLQYTISYLASVSVFGFPRCVWKHARVLVFAGSGNSVISTCCCCPRSRSLRPGGQRSSLRLKTWRGSWSKRAIIPVHLVPLILVIAFTGKHFSKNKTDGKCK